MTYGAVLAWRSLRVKMLAGWSDCNAKRSTSDAIGLQRGCAPIYPSLPLSLSPSLPPSLPLSLSLPLAYKTYDVHCIFSPTYLIVKLSVSSEHDEPVGDKTIVRAGSRVAKGRADISSRVP